MHTENESVSPSSSREAVFASSVFTLYGICVYAQGPHVPWQRDPGAQRRGEGVELKEGGLEGRGGGEGKVG